MVRPDGRPSPLSGKRKRYSADFKARAALEALHGEPTVAQLAAKHGVHQTTINAWKKQAIEGMAMVFSGKAEAAEAASEGEIDHLHAKIGQRVVERDFLRRPPGAERGGETRHDRTGSPAPADHAAMRPGRHQPVGVLRRLADRKPRDARGHAGDRRPVP